MSKKLKKQLCILLFIIGFLLVFFLSIFLYKQGCFGIYMKMIGEKEKTIEIHEPYKEEGILIRHHFNTITQNIKIFNHVDIDRLGSYEISYIYEDKQLVRKVNVVDTIKPILTLKGESHMILFQNEEYHDPGVDIYDNSKMDIIKNLKINNSIDSSKLGKYMIQYEIKDHSNNKVTIERMVEIVENPMNKTLHYHYDPLDNTRNGWWFKKANDHKRKNSTFDQNLMDKYNAFYIGSDEKVIYLTFDEGGSNITYIKEISDVLNNHDVNATFFLTRNYILSESDFIHQLVLDGHEIGNHTRRHKDMTLLANEENSHLFVSEIMDTQRAIYEVTKQNPPLIFRFPKGDFSTRSLAMVNDLGYRTYFWSHAYNDYGGDILKEEAYNNLVSHLHNGAIYLLHPANKGNYEVMDDFIIEAKKQGYSFELVSTIK